MTTVEVPVTADVVASELADGLVQWFETGKVPRELFAPDVLLDLSLPHWREQVVGVDAAVGIRATNHPFPGEVRVEALDATARGFLIQIEERWADQGQRWYCRELIHCVVRDGAIAEVSVYCTGDWDEAVQRRHAEQVHLPRP